MKWRYWTDQRLHGIRGMQRLFCTKFEMNTIFPPAGRHTDALPTFGGLNDLKRENPPGVAKAHAEHSVASASVVRSVNMYSGGGTYGSAFFPRTHHQENIVSNPSEVHIAKC